MIFNKLSGLKQESKTLLIRFCSLLALHLCLYACIRGIFYFWNLKQLGSLTLIDLLYAFMAGIRFDLVLAGPLCALIILIALWFKNPFKSILAGLLLVLQAALMVISMVDSELVNFMGRRFTVNSLYVLGEGGTTSILAYFPLIIAAIIILSIYFYFSFKKINFKQNFQWRSRGFVSFVVLLLAAIFSRGGIQEKPISFVNSKVINHPFAHQLVLNSAFTFIKSIGRDQLEKVDFFPTSEMLELLNLNPQLYQKTNFTPQKMNIIIIMVESLSSEYLTPQYTPFLAELSSQGVLFNPAYANGRRSVEGMAAILVGVPSLMEESFINSEFTNEFTGLGTWFKTEKYHTSFFHGGHNGTMRFDAFLPAMGFDHYFGRNEFNDLSQDDGAWGVYDKPFLKWTCQKISNFPERFASVIFTLTSHVPYLLPEDFKQRVDFGELKNEPAPIKSIHYTDEALKDFFECARHQAWFQNTLFILLGDHTGASLNPEASFKSKFEIPILFYTADKNKLKGLSQQQFAQQIDLFPTIIDFMGLQIPARNHLARSLFMPGHKTIALFSDQKYELVGDTEKTEDHLKAIRQYFSQGLYDNRLYFPQTESK